MWMRYILVPGVILLFSGTTPAGIFKKSPPKPEPVKQVPFLINTLKSDKDEAKRVEAAEELREYDPKTFPDLMPALIEALQNDPSSSVRGEAVNSLSKLRPVTQQSGYALEQASQNDASLRVRMSARTTLWQFHLLGYRTSKPPEKGSDQTLEPPLAPSKGGPKLTPVPKTTAVPLPVPTATPTPTKGYNPVTPQATPTSLIKQPVQQPTSTSPVVTPKTVIPLKPQGFPTQTEEPPLAKAYVRPTNPVKPVEKQVLVPLPIPTVAPTPAITAPVAEPLPTIDVSPTQIAPKPIEASKPELDGPTLTPPK